MLLNILFGNSLHKPAVYLSDVYATHSAV